MPTYLNFIQSFPSLTAIGVAACELVARWKAFVSHLPASALKEASGRCPFPTREVAQSFPTMRQASDVD